MEIHNHGKNLKVHFPVKPTAQNPDSVQGLNKENQVARTNETNPKRLLQQLKSGEAVRKQLLVEIQAKIQAGEYATRAAAEQAAADILNL